MDYCDKLGINKNICTAKDVKISLLETEESALIIAINSSPEKRTGTVALNKEYSALHVAFGQAEAEIQGKELLLTLEPNKSAVLRFDR